MPRRKKTTIKSKTKKSAARYSVPRSVKSYRGEFVIRKLRYAINLGLSHPLAVAGAMSPDYIYRANDMQDVYQAVGGHQPRGFDQYIAMFRNFAVLGSKIVVDASFGQASSTSQDMIVALVLNDTDSALTNTGALRENPRMTYKYLTAGTDKVTLIRKYSYKLAGVKDVLDEPNLWGTSIDHPSRQWFYHIVAYQPEGQTETIHITGHIDITGVFFNAVQPPQS